MQTIVDIEKDKKYVVKKLHTTGVLRQRLIAFGIIRGAEVELLNYTALKETYEVKVGKTTIALRKEEAQNVEVEEK